MSTEVLQLFVIAQLLLLIIGISTWGICAVMLFIYPKVAFQLAALSFACFFSMTLVSMLSGNTAVMSLGTKLSVCTAIMLNIIPFHHN